MNNFDKVWAFLAWATLLYNLFWNFAWKLYVPLEIEDKLKNEDKLENEANLKNDDYLKNEDDLKSGDDLKNEDDIKNQEDLKNEDPTQHLVQADTSSVVLVEINFALFLEITAELLQFKYWQYCSQD